MNKESRIYVAGHRGLVGSSLVRRLKKEGYRSIITRTHDELDLTNQKATAIFFEKEKPEYVFLAAAKVGGILANMNSPADFIYQNSVIQTNTIHQAFLHNTERLLFLGSSCIYPKECLQPIKEEYFLTGPLEPTNKAYAIAKIAGIEMCSSYNFQYGTRCLAVMPANMYGPGDNYDLQNSHVLPALIRKFHEAKKRGDKEVVVWGTGMPRREFLYSDDMADACIFLMKLSEEKFNHLLWPGGSPLESRNLNLAPLINIGCGQDLSIRELAETIMKIIGSSNEIVFDTTKPDGTSCKLLDTSRINQLGWYPQKTLQEGIRLSYQDFLTKELAQ